MGLSSHMLPPVPCRFEGRNKEMVYVVKTRQEQAAMMSGEGTQSTKKRRGKQSEAVRLSSRMPRSISFSSIVGAQGEFT